MPQNVIINLCEYCRKECKKQPLLQCQYLHDSQRDRQPHLKIHQPRAMKFKEKSSVEKVSVCPMPLMQFDTSERQKFNTSFPLSNDNCNRRLVRYRIVFVAKIV